MSETTKLFKCNMGDEVWIARCDSREKWITCPDCFGTKTLKVTLGDGTELVIPCAGCAAGYEPPKGVIRTYEYAPRSECAEITGLEANGNTVRYTAGCYVFDGENIFLTKEDAEVRAAELLAIRKQEEANRLQHKEKDAHSWAWHVHYYRDMIRKAEKDIECAREKLGIALQKAKA